MNDPLPAGQPFIQIQILQPKALNVFDLLNINEGRAQFYLKSFQKYSDDVHTRHMLTIEREETALR